MEQVPEFTQVVFNRCPGGNKFEFGLQGHGRLGTLGCCIFNCLSFIQDDCLPFYRSEQFAFLLEKSIGCDQHIKLAQAFDGFPAVFSRKEFYIDGGSEPCYLRLPVSGD